MVNARLLLIAARFVTVDCTMTVASLVVILAMVDGMALPVMEFQNLGYKIRKIFV